MALRSLILLVTLTVTLTAGFQFECMTAPAGTETQQTATTITAVDERSHVKVTAVGMDKLKIFRITAMDENAKEIVKGEFMIPDTLKELVTHLACGDANKAAVMNKDDTKEQGANVELTWKPAAGFKGNVKFVLVGVPEADKYFKAESTVVTVSGSTNGGPPGPGEPTKAPTKAAASSAGLSAWLVIVASGLFVALGLGHNMSAN